MSIGLLRLSLLLCLWSLSECQSPAKPPNACNRFILNKDGVNQLSCIKCELGPDQNPEKPKCTKCKYTTTDKSNSDNPCTPVVEVNSFVESRHNVGKIANCEGAYEDAKGSCFMCQEGYVLNTDKSDQFTCEKTTIPNCVVGDRNDGKERCFVCKRGFPDASFASCQPMVKEDVKMENCYFGMRHPIYNKGERFCGLCNAKYALVPENSESMELKCEPNDTTPQPGISVNQCNAGLSSRLRPL